MVRFLSRKEADISSIELDYDDDLISLRQHMAHDEMERKAEEFAVAIAKRAKELIWRFEELAKPFIGDNDEQALEPFVKDVEQLFVAALEAHAKNRFNRFDTQIVYATEKDLMFDPRGRYGHKSGVDKKVVFAMGPAYIRLDRSGFMIGNIRKMSS